MGIYIYFSGNSGGAGCAFYNAVRLPHAGVVAVVGYISGEVDPKGGDYVFINGAHDWNRSPAAFAAEKLGKRNSVLRYYPGGHHNPGNFRDWIVQEGMLWLNLRYLKGKEDKMAKEILDLEVGVLKWINDIKAASPHRAYHLAQLLQNGIDLSSQNKAIVAAVDAELEAPLNKRYVEGLQALDEFGRDEFAGFGAGAMQKHTSPAIQKAAQKFADEYTGVPEIEEIALSFKETTEG